ncbi:S8 family peptidase [Geomicrobium sp. JSM 1781026]|uniref:S8 family peptidase n=1 Tax=Geomicrobium sp. JSM 1781026 TaxID=3344580 RepID=UPI0035BF76A8
MKKPFRFLSGTAVIAATLLLGVSTTDASEAEKEAFLIGFEEMTIMADFIEENEEAEGALLATVADEEIAIDVLYEFEQIPVLSVEMTKEDVSELKGEESISYIEEDIEVSISQTIPWGIDRVQATAAHNRGITGNGVRVAVLDTGISNHPDLNIQGGTSFVPGEPGIADGNGHGTHVAGTIAALDNNVGVLGVAPDVDLFAVKVLGRSGSGSISGIAQGLQWSSNNNMDVANMSLGSPSPSPTLERAVNQATNSGVLVVAASGNSGASSIGYPARYQNAMAVGATDQNNNRASFSQFGAGLDIMAPGVGVQSTYPGNGYRSLSGTSMAAPHVAGVAALVMSNNPAWSPAQVRSHLNQTATPIGASNQYGNGLVNANAATQ